MREYLDQLEYEMQLCGMSPVSQRNYRGHVRRFLEFLSKPADTVGEEDVRGFLHHLRYERKLVEGTVNYYHTCIRFFFESVLGQAWNSRRVPRLRGYHTVPQILSQEEVQCILRSCENPKQQAILMTIYSAGLRNGEACRLQVQDIDRKAMRIFVRNSKRNRDRYTLLASNTLTCLREYWRHCEEPPKADPEYWLFPGQKPGHHISEGTVRNYLKQACQRAGITKAITVHTLRHCFATHFLEDGYTIYDLKPLLGHSSIASTARYVQLVRPDKRGLTSPMDTWGDDHDR